MSIISSIIAVCFLGIVLVAFVWIGVYVVLPIVLFLVLVSAIGSLVKNFRVPKTVDSSVFSSQTNESNHIIDVEYEEIK